MQCWCGRAMDDSLCSGCATYFIDCTCKQGNQAAVAQVIDRSVLTDRQRLVFMAYCANGSVKLAAAALEVHPRTIVNTLVTIRRKLQVESNIQALLVLLGRQEEQAA